MKLLAVEARQNGAYYRSRYERLEALGADVHVLNGEGTADSWAADRYRVIGSRDITSLTRAAAVWHAEAGFDGVVTFSESAVVAVAAVAEALGLPGIGVEAARTSRNKELMRRAHRRAGAPIPQFAYVPSMQEALAAADGFGYPVVLKPTLGAASNYVFRVDHPQELRERYAQAMTGLRTMSWYAMEASGVDLGPHGVLVESYLDGTEHLVEALVWDDEVFLGSIVDRVAIEAGTFDDDVHHAPTSLPPDDVAAIQEVVGLGAHAQGLHRSVMHAEVRYHRGEPHLLEIAVRPGGGGLDHMARLSAGYDPIAAVRDVACGRRPDVRHFTATAVHTAAMCLLCPPGRIREVTVPPDVQEADQLFFLKITAAPGDIVRRPPEGNTIVGFLGTTGGSFAEAMRSASNLADRITVTLAPQDA